MEQYRKKPVVIEAVQFREDNHTAVKAFCPAITYIDSFNAFIKTLEGDMTVSENDWIIKGVNGEFYPCKLDIFEKTYEPATQPPSNTAVEEELKELREWKNSAFGQIERIHDYAEKHSDIKVGESKIQFVIDRAKNTMSWPHPPHKVPLLTSPTNLMPAFDTGKSELRGLKQGSKVRDG